MNMRLMLATTAAVAIATSAFAQSSPTTSNTNLPTQRQQDSSTTPPPSSTTSTQSTTSSGSTQPGNPSSSSAQTQAPASSQNASGQGANSASGANTAQTPTSGSQAQTGQPANQANPPSSQAQTNTPSNGNAQTANPASTSNQAQSPTGTGTTNTAQQPNNQQNAADRSSSTNVNASVNINDQQRTRISQSISHLDVRPLDRANFSLSVGVAVPRDVRLQPLPAEVVDIVPQYRGYNFVLVKDEIVIVEPSSYQIVAVLPYSGRSTAAAPARTEQRKVTFSDREVIRKHAKARPVERERQTTGSAVRTEIRRGERVPEGVEVESFPEEVYRDAPTLREYRYINRDSHTYIVEPQERRVIEEID